MRKRAVGATLARSVYGEFSVVAHIDLARTMRSHELIVHADECGIIEMSGQRVFRRWFAVIQRNTIGRMNIPEVYVQVPAILAGMSFLPLEQYRVNLLC